MGVAILTKFKTQKAVDMEKLYSYIKQNLLLKYSTDFGIILNIVSSPAIDFTKLTFSIGSSKKKDSTLIGIMVPFMSLIRDPKDLVPLLVEISKLVYEIAEPQFGFSALEEDFEYPNYDLEYERIGWLTFFGPELVKKYGKKKLLNAPAYKVEELKDGGIMIRASYGSALTCFPTQEEIREKKLTNEQLVIYDEDAMRKKISEYLNIGVKN